MYRDRAVRLYDRYLRSLAALIAASTVALAVFGNQAFDLYVTVYVIEFLLATLLVAYLRPRAWRLLAVAAIISFAAFLAVLIVNAARVLFWTGTA